MNLEKLKPWNWFKHEDHSANQIPICKQDLSSARSSGARIHRPQRQTVDSLYQLHHEMDRLFEGLWRSFDMPSNGSWSMPVPTHKLIEGSMHGDYRAKLDVSGSDKEYEVSIDLPGLSDEDIDIELSGNTLVIKGHKEEKSEKNDKQYYRVERSIGAFQRILSLPEDADQDAISAKMKNGLLIITIARVPLLTDDSRRISISS